MSKKIKENIEARVLLEELEKMTKEKFSGLHQDVVRGLITMSIEQKAVVFISIKFFIFYFVVALIVTGLLVWLCSLFIESKITLIVCLSIIYSAMLLSLGITLGKTINYRISRVETYLTTLHQAILTKKIKRGKK